jgi:hypothetical protein
MCCENCSGFSCEKHLPALYVLKKLVVSEFQLSVDLKSPRHNSSAIPAYDCFSML